MKKNWKLSYELLGYVIRCSSNLTATWTKEGHHYSGIVQISDQDIVGMWVEPPVFEHWDVLDPRWKFIAADEDGALCVYTEACQSMKEILGEWLSTSLRDL